MTSALSTIPPAHRRRLAATAAAFAALFVVVGVIAIFAPSGGNRGPAVVVFSIVALVVAVLLALVAWGAAHSIRADQRPARTHACGCDHDHDWSQLDTATPAHGTPRPGCAHAAAGACDLECDSCVLARSAPQ